MNFLPHQIHQQQLILQDLKKVMVGRMILKINSLFVIGVFLEELLFSQEQYMV